MTSATREVYFGITSVWIMYLFLVPTLAIFAYGVYSAVRQWEIGPKLRHIDRIPERLRRVAQFALAQRRVLRSHVGGPAHALLLWSMILLFIGTVVTFVHEDMRIPIMQGGFYLYFQSLLLNIAGLLGAVALGIAAVHRYIIRPPSARRHAFTRPGAGEDIVALLWLLVIFVEGFMVSGLRMELTHDPFAAYRFVGSAFGQMFITLGLSEPAMSATHHLLWWLHLLTALGWIAWIPYSRTRHILAAPLAVFFASLEPKGTLPWVDIDDDEPFDTPRLADFRFKDLLDLEACTACERCQDVCPAFAAGASLSPTRLILDLRARAHQSPSKNGAKPEQPGSTAGDTIEEQVWACTTCRACEERCPVLIEHVGKIVAIRRSLMEREGPSPSLTKALESMALLGNPHMLPNSKRAELLEGIGVAVADGQRQAEVVLWIGCAPAYSDAALEATIATVKVLRAAGIDLAILGGSEMCCGDLARRSGEVGLYQILAQQNIANLRRLGVEKLLTTCPHCYNTMKNEYPRLGADFAVVHHTQLIHDILRAGRIIVDRPFDDMVTYQDPCYLGRYNDVYDAPREIIQRLTTAGLRELPRAREAAFCCGGGGGQMYREAVAGTRVNQLRMAEARQLGVPILATACPSCKMMLADAAQSEPDAPRVQVRDVAELVCRAAGL